MSDKSEILTNSTRLKAEHRALMVLMSEAYKTHDWSRVQHLAKLLESNVTARAWRLKKIKEL